MVALVLISIWKSTARMSRSLCEWAAIIRLTRAPVFLEALVVSQVGRFPAKGSCSLGVRRNSSPANSREHPCWIQPWVDWGGGQAPSTPRLGSITSLTQGANFRLAEEQD